jgi:hypothetical protein
MTPELIGGLGLALGSACALNWSYLVQHGAAAELPPLSLRRPIRSLKSLFSDTTWVVGFVTGIGGWVLYVLALWLAPLSLVQATSAGGIGLLALLVQRRTGTRLPRRDWIAVAVAVAGLVLLGVSLAGGSSVGSAPSWGQIGLWLVLSLVVAAAAAGPGARLLAGGAGLGVAAGVLYAAGDVATKAAVHGQVWLLLIPALLACHGLAFVALQLGFQRGGALATAGVASLLTNSLPIAAGVLIFHEALPGGILGVVRGLAFVCVVTGAALLARQEGGELPLPRAAVPESTSSTVGSGL